MSMNGDDAEGAAAGLSGEPPDLSKLPQMWLQVSSLEAFEVKCLSHRDLPLNVNASLADIPVEAERWPFASETQAEVSSRALYNMLTKAKTDAQLVGLQFMNLANQYKEERKRMVMEAKEDLIPLR